jgi:hypothetical protein
VLGWPPAEAEHADAADIMAAFAARREYDGARDKFLGRCMGAEIKDDPALRPDDGGQSVADKLKAFARRHNSARNAQPLD